MKQCVIDQQLLSLQNVWTYNIPGNIIPARIKFRKVVITSAQCCFTAAMLSWSAMVMQSFPILLHNFPQVIGETGSEGCKWVE